MTLKNLLTLCITFSFFASSQLEAAGPSTVEAELAKQKKYASDLMVSIDSGKYQGKQLEALKILHQKHSLVKIRVSQAVTAIIEAALLYTIRRKKNQKKCIFIKKKKSPNIFITLKK